MTQAPATFIERHLALSLVITVALLVLCGAALGQGVGTLGVYLCEAVLPPMDPPK